MDTEQKARVNGKVIETLVVVFLSLVGMISDGHSGPLIHIETNNVQTVVVQGDNAQIQTP